MLFANNTQWPVSIYVYRTAKPYSNSTPRDMRLFSLRISIFFRFLQIKSPSVSCLCFLCIILSLFRSAFLSFTLPLVFFSLAGCLLPYSAGDLNTVVLKPGILLLHVYHSFPSVTHTKKTHPIDQQREKKAQARVTIQFVLGYSV